MSADTIRMARQARLLPEWLELCKKDEEALDRFAALVAAAEREACAKVCDTEPSLPHETYTVRNNKATMRRCAAAIRARSKE